MDLRIRAGFAPASIDVDKRQATFVASTEKPIMVAGGPEALRMSGARLDRFKKNPVLLDTHDRSSADAVIGRSDVRVLGRQLITVNTYATSARGEQAWQLVKNGFVRAVSIGYRLIRSRRLLAGQIDGEGDAAVEGPATIADEWELYEVSNVPVPADPDALVRAEGSGSIYERTHAMLEAHSREARLDAARRASILSLTVTPESRAYGQELADRGLTVEEAQVLLLERLRKFSSVERSAPREVAFPSDEDFIRSFETLSPGGRSPEWNPFDGASREVAFPNDDDLTRSFEN